MWIAIQIIVAWFLADFITGVFHWWEDVYLEEGRSLEFLQGIAQDNRQHHESPTAITLNSWWGNMRSATVVALPTAAVFWLVGAPLWLWLGLAFTSFGNLIHRFAHEPERKRGVLLRCVQRTGLFISPEHHKKHHYNPVTGRRVDPKCLSTRAYCPMTDWVNPCLDAVRFWFVLEGLLALLGLKRAGRLSS